MKFGVKDKSICHQNRMVFNSLSGFKNVLIGYEGVCVWGGGVQSHIDSFAVILISII